MSGSTTERLGEPTLQDHVIHIGYLQRQATQWASHPEFGEAHSQQLASYRAAFPEAAAVYDEERAIGAARRMALGQQATAETVEDTFVSNS